MKRDHHVSSNIELIRHGAEVCRIVNWKGLAAYNVTSPLNIWTKFGLWLPLTVCCHPAKGENCVVSIIFFIEWIAKGWGGRSNCNLKF